MSAHELNLDGLVGPTHSYAGLSYGNIASQKFRGTVANPKQAALQGLAKMKLLMELGVPQAVLPPQHRPDIAALRRMGFEGGDVQVLERARRADPVLLACAASASSMWAANAATVSPSADSADGKVHFTPANLISQLHRSLEPATTARMLRDIFADERHFVHHDPLPVATQLSDEGAANHTRLCTQHDQPGVEVFTFGRSAFDATRPRPATFPARQALEASQTIARLHRLDPARTIFVQQHPGAIDAGVFHNDVIAVGHRHVLFLHERAYLDTPALLEQLRILLPQLIVITVREEQVTLAQAIETYLFNSQLVSLPGAPLGSDMALICPDECRQSPIARVLLEVITGDNPISAVHYVSIRQSMQNGGGPACLRLRVALTDAQLAAVKRGVILTDSLHAQLSRWVERHYRDHLTPDDLADPHLLNESRAALEELTTTLQLRPIYDFQSPP